MKTLRALLFLSLLSVVLVSVAPHAYAAGTDQPCTSEFCPLANVEGSRLGDIYANTGGLSGFLSGLFTMTLSIGAVLAVLRIGWAGYLYMGSDNWSSKGHARDVLGDVTLGLLLLLGSWLILNQINPDILSLNILSDLKSVN